VKDRPDERVLEAAGFNIAPNNLCRTAHDPGMSYCPSCQALSHNSVPFSPATAVHLRTWLG
jgi:hypothetical protein